MHRTSIWHRLAKCYPIWWESVILALVICSFWYAATNYAALPDRVPTHFGIAGLPDGWGAKNPAHVYALSLMSLVFYLGFSGLTLWIAAISDPKTLINRSPKLLETISVEVAVKGSLVIMFAYVSYMSISVAIGQAEGLGWQFYVLSGVPIIAAVFMCIRVS
jgi:uncharacterized membrane protein